MHLPHHQQMLRDAAAKSGTPEERAERIKATEKLIGAENPLAFQIEAGPNETLSQRVFMDQPMRGERNRGYRNFYSARAA